MDIDKIKSLYYYMNADGSILFNSNASIYKKEFGKLYRYTGEEILREWTKEQIEECEEKCYVKRKV